MKTNETLGYHRDIFLPPIFLELFWFKKFSTAKLNFYTLKNGFFQKILKILVEKMTVFKNFTILPAFYFKFSAFFLIFQKNHRFFPKKLGIQKSLFYEVLIVLLGFSIFTLFRTKFLDLVQNLKNRVNFEKFEVFLKAQQREYRRGHRHHSSDESAQIN